MNTYIIKKISGVPEEKTWALANIAEINIKPWKEEKYHFNSSARLLYSEDALYLKMESDETPVVARQTERNSQVCTDSCMEFFFSPNINDELYFNFEINALGTFLISVGRGRTDRIYCMDDEEIFNIKPQLNENGWGISCKIPFDFIKKYAGEYTEIMRGNFYKCGRNTGHRHFGVWNMVETPAPNFHCTEFFGELIFEK